MPVKAGRSQRVCVSGCWHLEQMVGGCGEGVGEGVKEVGVGIGLSSFEEVESLSGVVVVV